MGSSMGGLLSFYLVAKHPDVFGACGCVSTHFPLSEAVFARYFRDAATAANPDTTPYILRDIWAGQRVPTGTRYWFDYGTTGLDSTYAPTQEAVHAWLLEQGLKEGRDFVMRRYQGADHNEASWRARLEDPLTFLFGQRQAFAAGNLAVPAWTADAIWYQIFVERFRNGDPSNDPTAHDIEGFSSERTPDGWRPTPWSQDWYRQEPWARATSKDFYGTVQFRRYGGDLQGIMDRLDYLQNLGVTALFLNPINDAPSLHKYDARNYRHIDRNFGPDPRGDEARMAAEDPPNPTTWGWTAADSLFLALVREVHRRGMRIIIDYSWNHTGTDFWAWQDVLRNQRQSRFADWYEVERFDDPATPDTNEFAYRGWAGVPSLPEWKKIGRPPGQTHGAIDGNLVPGVRDLVFNVTRRWLDPNGDGDPADGVDGFRLDVADVVPLGFWRDYRRFVRGINPEAYLVGEVWWEQWPDKLYDPAPWLQGDVFDAVMHYQWYAPTRSFFAGAPPALTPTAYAATLDSLGLGISPAHQRAMMNLTASHDTPRFSTGIYNPGKNKYHATPREDTAYRIDRPDEHTRRIQQLILVQQFTYIGAPHIWNGDEVGMWGADDPDERKPMVWSDLRYDDETTHPFSRPRHRDRVTPDTALFRVYRQLIALRKRHLRLFADGTMTWLLTDDARGLLAYERVLGDQRMIIAFNISKSAQAISIPHRGRYRLLYPGRGGAVTATGVLRAVLPPRSARVWMGQ
jgi:glycosidase